jgi:hypothetical protein
MSEGQSLAGNRSAAPDSSAADNRAPEVTPACPACGGHLVEIRGKLVCTRCRRTCETCCEGGRG